MLHYTNFIILLTTGVSVAFQGISPLSQRQIQPNPRPNANYLAQMCSPIEYNFTLYRTPDERTAALANSPFPCDRAEYLVEACLANGTSPIDFLAEQECICPSSYWEVLGACRDCYLAHGDLNFTQEEITLKISSFSHAECDATPVQPFTNILNPTPINVTLAAMAPDIAIGTDRFPNQTAVSNYYTGNTIWTTGSISGSATARVPSWTASGLAATSRYTPTTTGAHYSTSASGSASGSGSAQPTTSTSGGGRLRNIKTPSGFLGIGTLLCQCLVLMIGGLNG